MAVKHQATNGQHAYWAYRLSTLFLGLVAVLLVQLAAFCIYNIFFHPLRHFKGPPLARVSKLWSRIGNFHGRKSERIHEAHLKYGPVVRVGPNEISFADSRAVREIYTSDNFVKEETFYRAKRIFHENHLFSFRNPEAHKKRRKLLSKGFSQAAMLEFESKISDKIQVMLDQWVEKCRMSDKPIDAYAWTHWLSFDIVYHLMFDEDPGSVTAGRAPLLMPYLRAWRPTFIYKELMPSLEQWGPYLPGQVGGYFRKVREWKQLAVQIIRQCRVRQTDTPFLRTILQGEKDDFLGRELTDSELAEECMGGMFGGSGTTANTFVYVVYACLRREAVTTRLRAELRDAFPVKNIVPDYHTCQSLPYLQAVISETLRLYPTIIATLPRVARSATVVAEIPVPAGVGQPSKKATPSDVKQTIVGTQNYTMHRDPEAFPDPEQFLPERWLGDNIDEEKMKAAWNPFSIGSRKCVAINLAQMELSKLVAAFFLRFDWAEIDSSMTFEDMRMYDTFNAGPAGAKLLIRVRE